MAFVIINYGENQRKLFNPECQTRFLIDNIKERCNYPKEMDVELSDEQGNIKNIWKCDEIYANTILNIERENLVLLQVKQIEMKRSHHRHHRHHHKDDVTYVPLLNNEKIVTSKFTARLSSRDDTTTSHHRGNAATATEHRNTRRGKQKGSHASGSRGDIRRSVERNDESVIPHPNTPLSNRKFQRSGSRTPSSGRSKSRGKQR